MVRATHEKSFVEGIFPLFSKCCPTPFKWWQLTLKWIDHCTDPVHNSKRWFSLPNGILHQYSNNLSLCLVPGSECAKDQMKAQSGGKSFPDKVRMCSDYCDRQVFTHLTSHFRKHRYVVARKLSDTQRVERSHELKRTPPSAWNRTKGFHEFIPTVFNQVGQQNYITVWGKKGLKTSSRSESPHPHLLMTYGKL